MYTYMSTCIYIYAFTCIYIHVYIYIQRERERERERQRPGMPPNHCTVRGMYMTYTWRIHNTFVIYISTCTRQVRDVYFRRISLIYLLINTSSWQIHGKFVYRKRERLFFCDLSGAFTFACTWCVRLTFNVLVIATHDSTLQHPATHDSTLQHTTKHCNTLQHATAHCNTLQYTTEHCNMRVCYHTLYDKWYFKGGGGSHVHLLCALCI